MRGKSHQGSTTNYILKYCKTRNLYLQENLRLHWHPCIHSTLKEVTRFQEHPLIEACGDLGRFLQRAVWSCRTQPWLRFTSITHFQKKELLHPLGTGRHILQSMCPIIREFLGIHPFESWQKLYCLAITTHPEQLIHLKILSSSTIAALAN